jgi:general secretion pathway protein J
LKPFGSAERRPDPRAGFSLLETLAALAIAAAAFAIIAEFSARALRNWNRGEEVIAAMEMLTRGIGRLQTDLSLSLPMSAPGSDGSTVLFNGQANSLLFAAATGFGAGNRGVELISVSIIADNDMTSVVRNRGPVANPQPVLRDPVVLLRGRMQIRFTYRDHNGQTSSSWVGRPELPSAVAVEIFGAQGNAIFPVPAVLALPQNYSVECFNPPAEKAGMEARCAHGPKEETEPQATTDRPGSSRRRQ